MDVATTPVLRSRRGLLFSTLPAIAVLAVLGSLLALQHHKNAVSDRHEETLALAGTAATSAERFVLGQYAVLSAVVAAPGIQQERRPSLVRYLRVVASSAGFTGGMAIVDSRGRVRASSVPTVRPGDSVAGREYIRETFANAEPTVSDAIVGAGHRVPVLAFAYPAVSTTGEQLGAVVGSLRLDEQRGDGSRPLYAMSGGETVLDSRNRVIVGGRPVRGVEAPPDYLPVAEMRRRGKGVIPSVQTPDGEELLGFATVRKTGWLVIVDRDYSTVIGPLDTALYAELLLLGIFTLLGVLAAASATRRLARASAERDAALAEQRNIAVRLQQSLLPELPQPRELTVQASYAPAQGTMAVGGDWYDVVELGDGRVALSVGDVAGHGLQAASAMGQLRAAVRTLALGHAEPADALSQLDRFAAMLDGRPLATVVFALLETGSGELRYAVAGHPPPFVVRADGSTELLTEGRSTLLGVDADEARPEASAFLAAGDTLVFYTDGLVEDPDSSIDAGIASLRRRAAAAAGRDPERLAALLVGGVGEPRRDDTAVLCVRVGLAQPSSVAS